MLYLKCLIYEEHKYCITMTAWFLNVVAKIYWWFLLQNSTVTIKTLYLIVLAFLSVLTWTVSLPAPLTTSLSFLVMVSVWLSLISAAVQVSSSSPGCYVFLNKRLYCNRKSTHLMWLKMYSTQFKKLCLSPRDNSFKVQTVAYNQHHTDTH